MLDEFFKFRIGDFVQPIGFQRSDKSYSIFEVRYRVVARMLIETGEGVIRHMYELRTVVRDGNVSHNLFQVGESELIPAERWSECGEAAE